MKKFIAALLAVLVAATSAAAYPPPPPPRRYGPPPPPPPPHHHRHPHDYCDDAGLFGGLAVGLMIGALASSQQEQAAAQANAKAEEERRAYEREVSEIRDAARQLAEAQSVNVMQIISKLGPDHALEDLDNYWQANGRPTLQDVNRPPRGIFAEYEAALRHRPRAQHGDGHCERAGVQRLREPHDAIRLRAACDAGLRRRR